MSIIDLPEATEVLSEIKPAQWTGGALPGFCRDELLHEIFERQADRTPDSVAVIDGMGEPTYGEVDQRSNQLAHPLRLRTESAAVRSLEFLWAARSRLTWRFSAA